MVTIHVLSPVMPLAVSLVLIAFIGMGCLEFGGAINQPTVAEACQAVTVMVPIKISSTSSTTSTYHGGIGVRIPNSWTVTAASYRGAYTGNIVQDQEMINDIGDNTSIPQKPGYKWWAGATDRAYLVTENATAEAILTLATGGETGAFSLDYVTGTKGSGSSFFFAHSNQYDRLIMINPAQSGSPILSGPANQGIIQTPWVTLAWQNPCGSTQYELRVSPTNNDGPGIHVIRNVTGGESQFTIPAPPAGYILLPDMTYSWQVRTSRAQTSIGIDDPSWGPWSEPRTFRTAAVSGATITPVSPTNGSTIGSLGPVPLQWSNAATHIFYYEIQVSGDPRFDTNPDTATSFVWWNLVHGGITSPPNSWMTPPLEPKTTYYWRVRPRVQGDGTPIAWSGTWSFQTQ